MFKKTNDRIRNENSRRQQKIQNIVQSKYKRHKMYFFIINSTDLQELLQRNESILAQTIKREEQLQHKYCVDIENAIKLNKQLNTIISKKNKILAELKVKQHQNDFTKCEEQKKLYKENASLFDDYAKIIELKEKEKLHNKILLEEFKKSMDEAQNKISDLEELKLKSDFKANLLENENKTIFGDLLYEIKKK